MVFWNSSKPAPAPATPVAPSVDQQIPALREFIREYNRITEICFADCVNDFTARSVSTSEHACTSNCLEKFLKVTQRVSQRFQEQQMLMSETQALSAKSKGLF